VAGLRQYEIWWALLPKPAGRRPVLLLSRNAAYSYLHKYLAAEITTTVRNIAVEVSLGRREGLPRPCVANFDNVHTIRKETLTERVGVLSPSRHIEVKHALGHALGWLELLQVEGRPGGGRLEM
jgi:mRNA interferase MazF